MQKKIEEKLNNNFSNVYDRFVDNRLTIHFGEDKTENILLDSKKRLGKKSNLDIRYGILHFLCYVLDKNLSREPMALQVMMKINATLRFLYRK